MLIFICWMLVLIGVVMWSQTERGSPYGEFGMSMAVIVLIFGFGMACGLFEVDWDQTDTLTDIYWLQDSTVIIVSYFENIKMVEHIADAHMLDAVRIDSVKVIYEKAYNSYGWRIHGEFRIIFSADSMNITIERNGHGT